jgi:phosphoserine phosphatase RsbU/P
MKYVNVTEPELAETTQVSPNPDRVRVLLIEDNPGDAKLIEIMLAEETSPLFELEWVDHLRGGLAKLDQGGFGLVLADLSLPDSQGLETFLQLHGRAPNLPIIVLSGLRDTTVAVQAVHEGAQDFLIKGQVNGPLLARAMRYAMERKRMSEQLGRYAEDLRSKNAQLEADFNMAREIQQIFLPNQYPTIPRGPDPQNSTLTFAHRYLSAAAVGGDFFDIFTVGENSAGVFICDVMGHGMRAALVTAIMRGLVEELLPIASDAGRFLSEINRSLHTILRRTRAPLMATAFYLIADPVPGEWRFSSAGHPSPLRLRRNENKIEWLKALDRRHGPALGLFERPTYPTCRCPMSSGDLVLLFSDGIYEVNDASGEEFGQERLLRSARRHLALPKERLLEELISDARAFAGCDAFDDDVCLVAVEAS